MTLTAIITAVGVIATAVVVFATPIVARVILGILTNLVVFACVTPIKWGVEAIHKRIHRE